MFPTLANVRWWAASKTYDDHAGLHLFWLVVVTDASVVFYMATWSADIIESQKGLWSCLLAAHAFAQPTTTRLETKNSSVASFCFLHQYYMCFHLALLACCNACVGMLGHFIVGRASERRTNGSFVLRCVGGMSCKNLEPGNFFLAMLVTQGLHCFLRWLYLVVYRRLYRHIQPGHVLIFLLVLSRLFQHHPLD